MTQRLLLLCHANIARSPAAELLARHLIDSATSGTDWQVSSRGIDAIPGRAIDRDMAAALRRRGIATIEHESRQATAADLREADLVLAFEARQRSWALETAPSAVRSTFTIRRAARVLTSGDATALAADSDAYTAADDFDDPFGKGPEVAEAAVAEIDELLRTILPAIGAAPAAPPTAVHPTRRSRRQARSAQ